MALSNSCTRREGVKSGRLSEQSLAAFVFLGGGGNVELEVLLISGLLMLFFRECLKRRHVMNCWKFLVEDCLALDFSLLVVLTYRKS